MKLKNLSETVSIFEFVCWYNLNWFIIIRNLNRGIHCTAYFLTYVLQYKVDMSHLLRVL